MLTLYCDASGKDNDQLLVVAGFIAPVNNWLRFEKEWDSALRKFGLRYFHMVEFAQSVKEFQGWKNQEDRRRDLLTALATVITRHASFWVGSCVVRRDYSKVDEDYELHEHFYPYPLCGRSCVDIAEKWRDAHHLLDTPVEYIFEGGDEHRGQLVNRVKEKTGTTPVFKYRLNAVALQAADFAAYELAKAYRGLKDESDELWQRFRTSFGLLRTVPNKWGNYDERGLRVLCRTLDIPRRAGSPTPSISPPTNRQTC
jgi:hypothetical protein